MALCLIGGCEAHKSPDKDNARIIGAYDECVRLLNATPVYRGMLLMGLSFDVRRFLYERYDDRLGDAIPSFSDLYSELLHESAIGTARREAGIDAVLRIVREAPWSYDAGQLVQVFVDHREGTQNAEEQLKLAILSGFDNGLKHVPEDEIEEGRVAGFCSYALLWSINFEWCKEMIPRVTDAIARGAPVIAQRLISDVLALGDWAESSQIVSECDGIPSEEPEDGESMTMRVLSRPDPDLRRYSGRFLSAALLHRELFTAIVDRCAANPEWAIRLPLAIFRLAKQ